MAVPKLESCCCGCTLKTGTKIIGYLSLIASFIGLVAVCIGWIAISVFEDHKDVYPGPKFTEESFVVSVIVVKSALFVLFLVLLGGCLLSYILLKGVYQNKVYLVKIWIEITLTFFIISTILGLIEFIAIPATIIPFIINSSINAYLILVVYSHYQEMTNVPNTSVNYRVPYNQMTNDDNILNCSPNAPYNPNSNPPYNPNNCIA